MWLLLHIYIRRTMQVMFMLYIIWCMYWSSFLRLRLFSSSFFMCWLKAHYTLNTPVYIIHASLSECKYYIFHFLLNDSIVNASVQVWWGRKWKIFFFLFLFVVVVVVVFSPFLVLCFLISSCHCPIEWNAVCIVHVYIRFAWTLKIQFISNVKGRTFTWITEHTLPDDERMKREREGICWCSHIKSTKTSPEHKRNPHHQNHAVVWFCRLHEPVTRLIRTCVCCVKNRTTAPTTKYK